MGLWSLLQGLLLLVWMSLLAALPGQATAAQDQEPGARPGPSSRPASTLVAGLRPVAMSLKITPTFDARGQVRSFAGEARLTLDLSDAVTRLELHALDLQFDAASLDGRPLPAPMLLPARQRVRLALPAGLARGEHELLMRYRGRVGAAPQGLFRIELPASARTGDASQPGQPGLADQILATQMEPTDARRLAPLPDEPAWRLPYRLEVVVPRGWSVIANAAVAEQRELAGGLVSWRFAPTPPMPSYLLALFIGRFDVLEDRSAAPLLRIHTLPGKAEQARLALDHTRSLLRWYEAYFDQPYPLPKLDQVALPGGFDGGMENWGALAYHESALLFDATRSPPGRRREVVSLLAHELAHQWFGNLVTLSWWDDLWLKEGFASWMAAQAGEQQAPGLGLWPAHLQQRQRAMLVDALASAQPVIRPVSDDREAYASFDDITYDKGMAFVRMLEGALGADTFRAGLRRYMADHRLGHAAAADLWRALEAASGRPVARWADAWLRRPGLPRVAVRSRCVDARLQVELEQRRLDLEGGLDAEAARSVWPIPLSLARHGPRGERLDERRIDFDQPRQTLTLPGCDGVLKLNIDGAGYYRVAYEAGAAARPGEGRVDPWPGLLAVLPQLGESDRVDLVASAWGQVLEGSLSATRWLTLVDALGDEASPAVWRLVLQGLRSIDQALEQAHHPALARWRQGVAERLRPRWQVLDPVTRGQAAKAPPHSATAGDTAGNTVGHPAGKASSTAASGHAAGVAAGATAGTAAAIPVTRPADAVTSTMADEGAEEPDAPVVLRAATAPSPASAASPGLTGASAPTPAATPDARVDGQQALRDEQAAELADLLLAELGRIDDPATLALVQARWRAMAASAGSVTGLVTGQMTGQMTVGPAGLTVLRRLAPAWVDTIGRHADAAQFASLRSAARDEPDAERRSMYWTALAGNRDVMLARQAMALARTDEVPTADAPWLLVAAARAGHVDAAWAELRRHHAALLADMTPFDRAALAPALLAVSGSEPLAADLLAWTRDVLGATALPAARQAAGRIKVQATLERRLLPQMAK